MTVPSEAAGLRLTAGERLYRAASPGAFELVRLLARVVGRSSTELDCRAGVMPEAPGPLFWFHGASAGEMVAAVRLTALLRQHGQRFTAAYTAANRAGVELITRAAIPDAITAFGPWDHPRWNARAFERWRPRALFLVETELWPGLILEAYRREVPAFCVSARIYARDFRRYNLVRGLTAAMLCRLTGILAQNETERARLLALGAPADRCIAAGNLKYLAADRTTRDTDSLRNKLGLRPDDQVIVCGSVHRDEIPLLFAALEACMRRGLRIIIAPRHRPAIAAITREARRRNWSYQLDARSPMSTAWQVLVLTGMGELAHSYAVASLAIVGGGFCKHGGHNIFEPMMLGIPVLFGRHCENFQDDVRALTAVAPESQVTDADELAARVAEWLGNDACRRQAAARQHRALPNPDDIAARYIAALSSWLPGTGASCQRTAAGRSA